ncbi:MAG TPA: tetratricopeptide repeat protein [Acidiferrobacter sp.]|nr:tetratricopeptide repeat protein [Acidiferrobacter sp.]
MTDDFIDDEMAALKAFFQKYGRMTMYAILAVVIGVGAGLYYHSYQARRALLAADLYNEMVNAASQQRLDLATMAGHRLEQGFSGSPYAGQAALLLAQLDYEQQKIPAAIADLTFAAHRGRQWVVRTVARLRLARLWLALGHPHKAWPYANIAKPYGFKAMALGLQAEILAREGQDAAADRTFTQALALAPKQSTLTTLWRHEQAQLAVSP